MAKYSFKPNLKRSLKLALIFQIAWAVAMIIALIVGYPVQVGLILLNMLVLWVPAVVELIIRTRIPAALQIHFYVFLTAAAVLGSAFEFYAHIPNWDTYVHVDSGVLIAWLGLFAVLSAELKTKVRFPRWFTITVALIMPMAFASAWEISEFLSDTFLLTSTQAGLEDTIIDMIAALVGALIAVALALWFKVPRSMLRHS